MTDSATCDGCGRVVPMAAEAEVKRVPGATWGNWNAPRFRLLCTDCADSDDVADLSRFAE